MAAKRKTTGRKKTRRKYSPSVGREVEQEMREYNAGDAHVKSRKQAIAIGLSKARKKGERVPPNPNSKKRS
jgi:hypothetical protein